MTLFSPRRRILALLTLVLFSLVVLPFVTTDRYILTLATQALIWALLASSWDIISGYTGQASFGHAGFFLIGAYTPAIATQTYGLEPWLSLPIGMAVTALVGLVVALPALRLRGHYLSIVTLAFAEIVQLSANNLERLTGGPFGMHDFGGFWQATDPLSYDRGVYIVVFLVVLASIAIMWLICERSSIGDAFRATREDEVLGQALGINTKFYKLLAFMLSAGFAGLAGGLFAFQLQLVVPNIGNANTSAMIIGMAVFGGLGTIWGPALGGLLLFATNEGLRFVGLVYNLVLMGGVIVVFVILVPDGIAGLLSRSWTRVRRRRADDKGQIELSQTTSNDKISEKKG